MKNEAKGECTQVWNWDTNYMPRNLIFTRSEPWVLPVTLTEQSVAWYIY